MAPAPQKEAVAKGAWYTLAILTLVYMFNSVDRAVMSIVIEPVKQEQFGSFSSIPMRPAKPNSAAMDSLFLSLEAGVDPIDAILELEGIE